LRKTPIFFGEKIGKIAEKCDHNIDPGWHSLSIAMTGAQLQNGNIESLCLASFRYVVLEGALVVIAATLKLELAEQRVRVQLRGPAPA
jgi:hypothetical protein